MLSNKGCLFFFIYEIWVASIDITFEKWFIARFRQSLTSVRNWIGMEILVLCLFSSRVYPPNKRVPHVFLAKVGWGFMIFIMLYCLIASIQFRVRGKSLLLPAFGWLECGVLSDFRLPRNAIVQSRSLSALKRPKWEEEKTPELVINGDTVLNFKNLWSFVFSWFNDVPERMKKCEEKYVEVRCRVLQLSCGEIGYF